MSDFEAYASPWPSAAYSAEFFSSVTFRSVSELTYPTIAPEKSLVSFVFEVDVPANAAATVILPGEVIPHLSDVLNISSEMRHAYTQGMRSVAIHLSLPSGDIWRRYHFSKITLFKVINNKKIAIFAAQKLSHHIVSLNSMPTVLRERFLSQRIFTSIRGFHVTDFPLWKLSDLMEETWIEEDIMNALAELTYFKRAALTPSQNPPPYLYLPTKFLVDARYLFNQSPRVYSPELLSFRRRMLSTTVDLISLLSWLQDHYSAYILSDANLLHGDSLGHLAEVNDLVVLQWILAGIPRASPRSVREISVPQQNNTGITASTRWTSSTSGDFRNQALQDLIHYDQIASELTTAFVDWAEPCIPIDDSSEAPAFCGYADFNMYTPLETHPIHQFLTETRIRDIPVKPCGFTGKISLVDSLPSASLDVGHVNLELEDHEKPSSLQFSPRLPNFEIKLPRTPSDDKSIIDLISPPSSLKSKSKTLLPDHYIDLTSPSPSCNRSGVTSRPPLFKRSRTDSIEFISLPTTPEASLKAPPVLLPVTRLAVVKRARSDSIKIISDRILAKSDFKPLPSLHPPPTRRLPAVKRARTGSIEIIPPPTSAKLDLKPDVKFQRTDTPVSGVIRVGSFFKTWEAAQYAIYEREAALGHKWIRNQTKMKNNSICRITFRCHRQSTHTPKNSMAIDPSDRRRGQSSRVGCQAHVNVCKNPGGWHVSTIAFEHNHDRSIPIGGTISRPPTHEQRAAITDLARIPNLRRSQVMDIVKNHPEFSKPLEPRQISNIITKARSDSRNEISAAGGDFIAILAALKEKSDTAGWNYDVLTDETNTVTAVFWQSDTQVELGRRFHDILLNDNSYNRNNCGYPLNLGIIVDSYGKSRNVFQVIHAREDAQTHSWVLRCHVKSARAEPEVFGSDRDAALIRSATETLPTSLHIYCLHHTQGNVVQHSRRLLGASFGSFMQDFWATYRAVSPEEFDRLWNQLTSTYSAIKEYLDTELYPCRKQWAWAWISTTFTAGVRTTGRVESENRVTKAAVGAKTSAKQLYDFLNERSLQQTQQDYQRVRDSSRKQHDRPIESIFPGPLALLREHAGPFALHTCYGQMELSLTYRTDVVQLPDGIRHWNEYAIKTSTELGFNWEGGEERHGINAFTNDKAYISTRWLLRLISNRGHHIKHLLRVTRIGTSTIHYVAILSGGQYICDCCLKFHIGLVRARWYQNPDLDVSKVSAISLENVRLQQSREDVNFAQHAAVPMSNPLDAPIQARRTDTLPARAVFHETQAAIRNLSAHVQTQEHLDNLLEKIYSIQQDHNEELRRERLQDPLTIEHKEVEEVALYGRGKAGLKVGTAVSVVSLDIIARRALGFTGLRRIPDHDVAYIIEENFIDRHDSATSNPPTSRSLLPRSAAGSPQQGKWSTRTSSAVGVMDRDHQP
ncbi:hypothetical protein D9615_007698 [Tricholomella constricta]|uniref:MULE transposase domain-containing protein n=1 Tax=Tricholomella constricta TaxID=117010 RepID=A0A8H5M0H1_9AGAR|nr:hypothetical protein D9615_007698 [Tricholomella constricta]